jgi:hypothetical protein
MGNSRNQPHSQNCPPNSRKYRHVVDTSVEVVDNHWVLVKVLCKWYIFLADGFSFEWNLDGRVSNNFRSCGIWHHDCQQNHIANFGSPAKINRPFAVTIVSCQERRKTLDSITDEKTTQNMIHNLNGEQERHNFYAIGKCFIEFIFDFLTQFLLIWVTTHAFSSFSEYLPTYHMSDLAHRRINWANRGADRMDERIG